MSGEAGEGYRHTVLKTDAFDEKLPQVNVILNNLSSQADGLSAQADGSLKVSVTSVGDFSSIRLLPTDQASDSLQALVSYIGDESTQPFVNGENRGFDSRVLLPGDFFNNISDFGNGTREGNGRLTLNFRNYADGGWSRVLLCAQLLQADGQRTDFVAGTEDGDNDGCASNSEYGRDYNNDQEYRLGLGIDRESNSVFFQRDDNVVQMPTTEPFFEPFSGFLNFQTQARGVNSKATVIVKEISTEQTTITNLGALATRPAYRNLGEYLFDDNRDLQVQDGQLRMTTVVDGSSGSLKTSLRTSGSTDYLAADLILSSESRVLESSTGGIQLQGRFFNDLSNLGFNGGEGDHDGALGVMTNGNGEVFGQACLTRSQTSNFEQRCELLATSGSNCVRFSSPLSFDTAYEATIEFDRTTRKMIFRLNGEEIEHELLTNVFF